MARRLSPLSLIDPPALDLLRLRRIDTGTRGIAIALEMFELKFLRLRRTRAPRAPAEDSLALRRVR